MGCGVSIWDVGCPGLHDRLDGGDAGGGGQPHFGIQGVPMEYRGSQWDVGGPNGIQGVPKGYRGSQWEMRGPIGKWGSRWDTGGPIWMWGVQVYMIDWMEEMQVVGGGPTSGYGGN